jgi:hypothetical protein
MIRDDRRTVFYVHRFVPDVYSSVTMYFYVLDAPCRNRCGSSSQQKVSMTSLLSDCRLTTDKTGARMLLIFFTCACGI